MTGTPPLVYRVPIYVVLLGMPLAPALLLALVRPVALVILVPAAALMACHVRAYLVADDDGLTMRTFGLRTRHVPWSDVAGIDWRKVGVRGGAEVRRTRRHAALAAMGGQVRRRSPVGRGDRGPRGGGRLGRAVDRRATTRVVTAVTGSSATGRSARRRCSCSSPRGSSSTAFVRPAHPPALLVVAAVALEVSAPA